MLALRVFDCNNALRGTGSLPAFRMDLADVDREASLQRPTFAIIRLVVSDDVDLICISSKRYRPVGRSGAVLNTVLVCL